jgi:predicted component of type VI protein secretion system
LFSADELRHYAGETAPVSDDRASVHEPVLACTSVGLRFKLHAGRQTVGRSADNDIVVGDPGISASHAWIIGQHGQYAIMNTLSTNGTFVNGKRIHEAILKHNDHIQLGQIEFVFLTRELDAANPARSHWILAGSLILAGLVVLAWWLI